MFGLMLCSLLGCGEGLPDRSTDAPEIAVAAPTDDAADPAVATAPPRLTDAAAAVPDAQLSSSDSAEPQPTAPPPDTDGDGVIDTADNCPDTEQGKQVDAAGARSIRTATAWSARRTSVPTARTGSRSTRPGVDRGLR